MARAADQKKSQVKFVPRIFTRWTFWAVAAGVLLAYAAAGFLLVPRLVRSQLISAIDERYDREAHVGAVRFNPFTFVLEIDEFALPDIDGRALLGFRGLLVDFELISVLRRGYSFAAIALDQPKALLVVRRDGSLNLVDLAARNRATPPAENAGAAELPRLFIGAFTVRAGRIDFEDHRHSTPFVTALQPITFSLRDFSTTGSGDNAYALDAESVRGERLSWRGTLYAGPVSSSGTFSLANVQARTLWDYVRDSVAFEVPAGTLSLSGRYEFSLARKPVDLEAVADAIDVRGLVVRPKGATVDDIALGELSIRGARMNVADRLASVDAISFKGGKVQAWLEPDYALSLSRLLAHPVPSVDQPPAEPTSSAPPASPPDTGTSAGRWRLALPLIETSGVEIAFEDRTIQPAVAIKLAPVDVRLTDYASDGAQPLGIDARIGINDEGELVARGTADVSDRTSSLDLELKSFDLRDLQPYIGRVTDMTLTSGRLGFNGRLELARAQETAALAPRFAGTLDVARLRTIDNALEQDFIRWDALRVLGIDFDRSRSRLAIKEVVARRPYARVIIASDRSVNISQVLRPTRSRARAAGEPARTGARRVPLAVRIGLVRVDKASANFADYSLQPNFATGIQELSGTVKGLSSSPASRAVVDLDGKVDAYAPVTIEGEVNFLSAETYTDLRLAFDNMELTTFTPYSGKFAGYRIEKGKLSVRLAYHVEDRTLDAQHKIILDQLQLGERVESKDATSLPVKLAVALLKDRNGVIDLDLPVTGSLDDPKFRLGPLIWKVVVNLVTKIVTAPFALLGSLFGGGEEVNQLTFAAGTAELQGESRSRIDAVAKALRERPGLELEVPMVVNADVDRPRLQRHQLQEQLVAVKRRELLAKRKPVDTLDQTVLADRNEYFRLLNELASQKGQLTEEQAKQNRKAKPAAEMLETEITALEDLVLPGIEVPETELAELGKRRAQTVQDLLLASGEIEPGRVFVITAPPAPIDAGMVRMDLSLR
jgi:hypothetical protein